MSPLEQTCHDLLMSVDDAVACGVLDLDTGHLLAMSRVPSLSPEFDDVFASAVADTFFNRSVAKADEAVRGLLSSQTPGVSAAQEILITTAHSFLFAKRLGPERASLLLVTTNEANVGLSWAQLRAMLPNVQQVLGASQLKQKASEEHPVERLLRRVQAAASSPDGTLILGQPQRPAGLVLLDEGQVSWASAKAMPTRLSDLLWQYASRSVPEEAMANLMEQSRREGKMLGESMLAAGLIEESGLRRTYLTYCASALTSLSGDAAARSLTWRSGTLVRTQSPFRFSLDELLREAQTLPQSA